ncbi:hypothetical protein P4639_22365 [Priestia megaterium]|uniref:hypothetical protein n=1 Tax=Priestia megaterium TaxID=1404 RepID=UPI002E1C2E9E|nr:hypothetical protein [Priestia megaterium]
MNQHTNLSAKEIKDLIANGQKPMMFYHIPKEEVLKKDFRGIDKVMNTVQTVGKGAKQSVIITCNGYDDVADELYEIKEVREFVQALFSKYPHLFYYINTQFEAEKWIMMCIADKSTTISQGERLTANEIFERYGLDQEDVPQTQSLVSFNGAKFLGMLKSIIKHGKKNKDVKGGKNIAIEYALRFDDADRTLDALKITSDDIRSYISGISEG